MSDGTDQDDQRQQDRVRRLLADVAATDAASPPAVPDDVAARVDAALTGLTVTDSATGTGPRHDVVVPLRRRLAPLLAAAAAVVVVAGGGALALTGSGGDEASDQAAGSSADSSVSASSEQAEASPEAGGDAGSGPDAGTDASTGGPGLSALTDESVPDPGTPGGEASTRTTPAPYLTRDDLVADVTDQLAAGSVAAAGVGDTGPARERVEGSGCVVPAPERGAATFVVLEGDPAVLVVGSDQDGSRPVEVLDCADGSVVARARVAAG